jgi:pimeloyl-ACP methyl ester carboxylesterase
VTEPRWLDVTTPDVTLRALTWGPADGPIALCLRGYAPSSVSSDGSYHVGALLDDALSVLDAAGPTDRDVLIGHDWGAIAGTGLAAMPDSPFRKAVIMSVPPSASFRGKVPNVGGLVARMPRQLLRSWYIMYFQLPWLPERSASWVVSRLWRQWSPGYKPPERFAELHQHWLSAPTLPTLYLHGADDGCATSDYAHWVEPVLPEGSRVQIVDGAGHFMQLDRPDVVAGHIMDFVGR